MGLTLSGAGWHFIFEQTLNRPQGIGAALRPVAVDNFQGLPMVQQPAVAVLEKNLSVGKVWLTALTISDPAHPLRTEQQMQIVMPV